MKKRKTKSKSKVTVKGYIGEWADGTLGWSAPQHLSKHWNSKPSVNEHNRGSKVFLCKITIEKVKDSLGRPITRELK